ncbi:MULTISPECIES: LPS-assembly protein LptD [unclassified Acinetobacter]|uniref:LPS-assembly protein LptD n=1 Tax=unclassified Acinetobacter TaxID=196816 RepID=UPI0035B865FA
MKTAFKFNPLFKALFACASVSLSSVSFAQTTQSSYNSNIVNTPTSQAPAMADKNTKKTDSVQYAEMYQKGADFFSQYYQTHPVYKNNLKTSSQTDNSQVNQSSTENVDQSSTNTAEPRISTSNAQDTSQNIATAEQKSQQDTQTNIRKNTQNKNPLSQLYRAEDTQRPALCSGQWVTPIPANQPANGDVANSTSTITADQGYYNPQGVSYIEGDVIIEQQGRQIRADKVELDPTQTFATAKGKVQIAQNGLVTQSDEIQYNLKSQTGNLNNSFYISEQQQAHGYARQIQRPNDNSTILRHASYTTCAPSTSPTWHIQAKEITIDQDTGRGISKDTRLYIKNVPVLAVPYFNFPIDDRRTSGFLTPSFGYTNDGGVQLAVPYYLNLAPNYDMTVTPRYLHGRGVMAESEFRYLTEKYGQGQIWGGYLPSDRRYAKQDRKSLHLTHDWQVNSSINAHADINYISDKDYFADLGNTPNSSDSVYQPRSLMINYRHPKVDNLSAQLRVQSFQTLDTSIPDANRPYARIPQLLINYHGGHLQGWNYRLQSDSAYFKKPINDGSALERSGARFYNQADLSYNYQRTGFYAKPTLSLRSLYTVFDRDSKLSQGFDQNESVSRGTTLPQFTLDTGLIFDQMNKTGQYLHTLKPRLFYAYTPYHNQDDFANFDSTYASIGYDQLFSPYRFYGHDRIEDNHFASLGLSYSLFDQQGLEKIRASLGQSYYFANRQVQLQQDYDNLTYNQKTSGPVLSLSSQLYPNLYIHANSAWLSNGKNALNNFSANYNDDHGASYQLGYYQRREINDLGQQAYQQTIASIVQPIDNNWRALTHVQYDLKQKTMREVLLGLNYESCCWGLSVYGRRYYNDLADIRHTKPTQAIMAEFSLKGLGGLSGRLTSLLEQRMFGYNRINQSWN